MNESPAGVQARYQAALNRGEFLIQRCDECGQAVFFPRELCPHCGADEPRWEAPSGRGQVYATTVVRRKPEDGGDYNVALIDLEEGVRLMSRVEGLEPSAVRIGLAVQARVQVEEGSGLLLFDVAERGEAR